MTFGYAGFSAVIESLNDNTCHISAYVQVPVESLLKNTTPSKNDVFL
jgi:hypothetical protein